MALLEEKRTNFVRITLGGIRRKLSYKHKDIRDCVQSASHAAGHRVSIGELFTDPFGGWPYLLLFGLRWQSLKVSLDGCSQFIDEWVEEHKTEKVPLDSMGQLLIDALNQSGFIRIKAEEEPDAEETADTAAAADGDGKDNPED